jgi:hypothetical protein
MVRFVLCLALFASCGLSQHLSVGARGGLPLTDAFDTTSVYSAVSRNWVLGPTVEVRLPLNLGLEFDALYRKVAYRAVIPGGQAEFTSSQWQFPLLAKYSFPGILLHPFVDGGVVFNKLSYRSGLGPKKGVALGAGIELRFSRVRVAPEIRYTRLGEGKSLDSRDILHFRRNQADLFVGITF